jgi:hypothetical protein
MRALLREYAQRGADIAEPSEKSLIGRTRALLARLECSAPLTKETAMEKPKPEPQEPQEQEPAEPKDTQAP